MGPKKESRLDRRISAAAARESAQAPAQGAGKADKTADATKATKTVKAVEKTAAGKTATDKNKAVEKSPALQKAEPLDQPKAPRRSMRDRIEMLKRIAAKIHDDELVDRAAALTYYGFLAVFPTLLLAVSVLGLLSDSATTKVLDNVQKLAPGSVRNILHTAITQVRASHSTGGTLAVAGVLGALWSASGYVGAFIRASNVVYDTREQRPVWKTTPLRIGLTVLMMVTSMISVVIVVFTGPLADDTAKLVGLGGTAVTIWSIAKWPVLVLLMAAMIVLLFWAAPDVRGRRALFRKTSNQSGRRFHWISPGSALAVVLWLILSTLFAAYIANFASYNKTYGTVAGVIVFLLWLWLSNLAILVGLEFDADLARESAGEQ
jgi:membrane protein